MEKGAHDFLSFEVAHANDKSQIDASVPNKQVFGENIYLKDWLVNNNNYQDRWWNNWSREPIPSRCLTHVACRRTIYAHVITVFLQAFDVIHALISDKNSVLSLFWTTINSVNNFVTMERDSCRAKQCIDVNIFRVLKTNICKLCKFLTRVKKIYQNKLEEDSNIEEISKVNPLKSYRFLLAFPSGLFIG